jgi:hypothetical protein
MKHNPSSSEAARLDRCVGATASPLSSKRELNKGQWEERMLRWHLCQHRAETVSLVTSLPPSELDATEWLAANWAVGH